MGKLKKIVIIALCVVMAVSVSACSMAFVNEDRDLSQVVAEVNGTKLLKSDFINMADSYAYSQYNTLYSMFLQSADASTIESFNAAVMENLVNGELLYQEALKQGLADNSEEGRKAVEDEINATIEAQRQTYLESAQTNEQEDPEGYADEMIQSYITAYGYDDMETSVSNKIKNDGITAMQEKLNNEVSYTEEQAKELYDLQVDSHVSSIEENPSLYAMYQSLGSQVFARPAASRYVKHILIALPDDVQTEISTLRNAGDDEGADALRDEELAKIQADADAALARVNAGEDFDELMAELGEDPGMQSEPGITEGYLVIPDAGTYVEEFETGALALENVDDVSGLIASDYGYHIMKYIKDAGGKVPFDEVKDDMVADGLALEQQSHVQTFLSELKETAKIKTYENRLAVNS